MRKIVNEGLVSLNYDSSVCKSKWDKSPAFPGEYEYIDVIIGEERMLIDVDFRSEFDIARQTSGYKALLQSLSFIFVGKSDRLSPILFLLPFSDPISIKCGRSRPKDFVLGEVHEKLVFSLLHLPRRRRKQRQSFR